jgi:hypothetical protein
MGHFQSTAGASLTFGAGIQQPDRVTRWRFSCVRFSRTPPTNEQTQKVDYKRHRSITVPVGAAGLFPARHRGGEAGPDPFAEGRTRTHSDAMFVVVDLRRGPPRVEVGCRLRFAHCVQRTICEIRCSGSQAAGGVVRRSASTSGGRCGCCLGSPCSWR